MLRWEMEAFHREMKRFTEAMGPAIGTMVAQWAHWLLAQVVFRTPIGNPILWQNPGAAPPGYVGGTARNGWHMEDEKYTGSSPHASVVNSVPYIVMLEFGWSKQAPKGMLRISLKELRAEVRKGRTISPETMRAFLRVGKGGILG